MAEEIDVTAAQTKFGLGCDCSAIDRLLIDCTSCNGPMPLFVACERVHRTADCELRETLDYDQQKTAIVDENAANIDQSTVMVDESTVMVDESTVTDENHIAGTEENLASNNAETNRDLDLEQHCNVGETYHKETSMPLVGYRNMFVLAHLEAVCYREESPRRCERNELIGRAGALNSMAEKRDLCHVVRLVLLT